MRKIFALAAVVLLSCSAVMAQDYIRYQASFVANKMTNSEFGDKEITPKGINLGAVAGFGISDVMPLYLETGLNMTWAHSAADWKENALGSSIDGEVKFTYMNVAIPVNAVYKYEVNEKVALSAHAGLNLKVNFMAKYHEKYTEEIAGVKKSVKYDYSMLSKKDMGSRDDRANIFQLGGQIGLGVHLSQIYIGYQFQTDFMKFQQFENLGDKHKWLTNYITLGYTL